MRIHVESIGRVESKLKDLASASRQADEGAPEAWLISPAPERTAVALVETSRMVSCRTSIARLIR